MRLKSTIVALLVALSLVSLACSKSGGANMSDEDKHKLFQAAGVTGDPALITEVSQKLGLIDSSGRPTSDFEKFTKDHIDWGMKNADWAKEYSDKAKARDYVKSHMP